MRRQYGLSMDTVSMDYSPLIKGARDKEIKVETNTDVVSWNHGKEFIWKRLKFIPSFMGTFLSFIRNP